MGSFASWNPYDSYVQGGMVDGKFVSGGLTLIASGPPRLAEVGATTLAAGEALGGELSSGNSDIVYPIGGLQNINHSQNKNFMRIWELGSERSYSIGTRCVGQLGLSSIYYHGPSLLRRLYAYFQDTTPPVQVPWVFPNTAAEHTANPHDVIVPPGYQNLFLNLASDMFNQPIGLMFYLRDSNLDTMGAVYFEAVTIPQHSWATDSQGAIVQEQAALQYERIIPVDVAALPLVSGFEVV